jgi:hypothetical protein
MKNDIGKMREELERTTEPVILQTGAENCTQKRLFHSSTKTAIFGVLWIVGACWFVLYSCGNLLNELKLIRRAHTVPGSIIDTWEDVEDRYDGQSYSWIHGATYTYRLPDGREFTQHTKEGSGRLSPEFHNLKYPYPVEVEYLPDNPTVSRIKGDGHKSILSWLLFKIGLGSLLLVLLSIPGVGLLRDAVLDFKRLRRMSVASEIV